MPLFVDQLRSLHMRYPQPRALPRLPIINRAIIYIVNVNPSTFQPEELFEDILPFISALLSDLEHLQINLIHFPFNSCQISEALSEKLSKRMWELFPKLHHCTASYYSIIQPDQRQT